MEPTYVKVCDQNGSDDDEWRAARRQGVGGSDAAAVVGLDRWRSPLQVWADKVHAADTFEDSEPALWGRLLEDTVAEEFARRTGLWVWHPMAMFRHPEHPWMLYTPDRLLEDNGEVGLLEIKTTSAHQAEAWEDGDVPDRALIQANWGMAVLNLPFAYVAALIGGQKLVYTRVERSEQVIDWLVEEGAAFWQLVEDRVEPAAVADGDASLIAALHPAVAGLERDASDEVFELVVRRQQLVAQVKELEAEQERTEAAIKQAFGEAELLTYGGRKLASWKASERRGIDLDALRAEMPEVAAKFEKKTPTRTFRVSWKESK
jgi:putative phage-type endonuclease